MSYAATFLDAVIVLGKACVVVALLLLARGLAWLIHMLFIAPLFDPLGNLPGPEGSALQNHFREVMDPNTTPDTHKEWVRAYGKTFRFNGFGRHDYRFMSFDFRAISHVLNSPIYEKPWQTRTILSKLLGRGIFAIEGAEHKVLRKLIGPAFTSQSIKAMTPVFLQKAEELRDKWDTLISEAPSAPARPPHRFVSSRPSGPDIVDVSHWFSRATFDVIGLAGFDYHFRSLEDESEPVYRAYRDMFAVQDKGPGLSGLVRLYFPILDKLYPDEGTRITRECQHIVREAGKKVVESKKAAILAEKADATEIQEKDILSLLIKSNLSSDPSKRLSDTELLDQLSTFLFAGSDSTSLSLSWCIHYLSLQPDVQSRLREELLAFTPPSRSSCSSSDGYPPSPPPTPTRTSAPLPPLPSSSSADNAYADALDALPLLDGVIRETLRVAPPVHGTIRVATEDTLIPVSKPVLMRDGTLAREIPVRRGSYIHIPIEGLNLSEDVWGKDALEYNPDRWASLPAAARPPSHPGLANLMSFSMGPHACPGYKFSLLEMKFFLAVLIPHFSFAPATGRDEVRKYNAILTRPYLQDRFDLGTMLPVRVERVCG